MSAKVESKEIDTETVAFVAEHTKSDVTKQGTRRSMTQGDYLGFMKSNGITRQVIDSVFEAETKLVSGVVDQLNVDLAESVKQKKTDGEDPAEAQAEARISRPQGSLMVRVAAETHGRNPTNGEATTHFGVVTVRTRNKGLIPDSAAERSSELFSRLLGKN